MGQTSTNFVECDECRKKPGTPPFCEDCLKNGERRSRRKVGKPQPVPDLKKMKARVEFVGDFEDVKKVSTLMKEASKKENSRNPAN